MEVPSTKSQWGLAAILGCGLCCGGLLGNAAWVGATGLTLAGLLSGWGWLAIAASAVLLTIALVWRARQRRSCRLPEPSR